MAAFEDLVLFRWDIPSYLFADNDTKFVNGHVTKILQDYGIRHTMVPPYHPQANPVERTNRILKTTVIRVLSPVVYKLEPTNGGQIARAHVFDLK